jgi:alkyl sulfatase BDS1-like metallo-beta-lactamase superfamily hydrolase
MRDIQIRNADGFPGVVLLRSRLVSALIAASLVLLPGCGEDSTIKRKIELKAVEAIGKVATSSMPDDMAGGFHKIPIEVVTIAEDVYQVMGIGNTHMVVTSEGNVMYDTGISIQAAEQVKKLKAVAPGPITHIILSHSHADHITGARFWKEKDTEIVTHREFAEEQRYLTELEPYLHNRNRTVFPWMTEEPTDIEMLKYGGVVPTITVDESDYNFTQGGVEFEVLSTPGAEGADNISLWLPEKKILFTGDTLGPNFPQFPNIFTMRGEKVRKPMEYINTLDKLIALDAEILVPSHRDHIVGKEAIRAGLTLIRDATQYVHDEVIAGMNAGKSVYQLMKEIRLPPELELTQEHGLVSWGVRSIWEYYATWFHFDSPTELYPIPARDIYADLAELAGVETLLEKANKHLSQHEPVHALHFLEVIIAKEPGNVRAIEGQLAVYKMILQDALDISKNNYEKDYMRTLITQTEARLEELGAGAAL